MKKVTQKDEVLKKKVQEVLKKKKVFHPKDINNSKMKNVKN